MTTAVALTASQAKLDAGTNPASWYALYTSARHEKAIAARLVDRRINHLVPLYRSIRKWKDRKVEVDLPLFPGYVFVQIDLARRFEVLNIPGAVRFVSFHGSPEPLAEAEVTRLRTSLDKGMAAEPCPYVRVGRRVRVTNGPMAGAEGILIRKKRSLRFVLSLELIQRSIAVEIDASDVEPIQ